MPTLLMMALLFGAMYFLFIRPNKKRRQQIDEMQKSIGPGDEVLTIGGLYGYVSEIDDEKAVLEVSPGVFNTYSRSSISRVVTAASTDDETDEIDEVDDDLAPDREAQPAPSLEKRPETPDVTAKKVIDQD